MFEGTVGCNFFLGGAVGVAVTDQEIFNIENAFEEAVDRCGLSSQDSLIWEYDEFSTGWDGEEWGADYGK